jgi:hypothetical protein
MIADAFKFSLEKITIDVNWGAAIGLLFVVIAVGLVMYFFRRSK